MMFVDGMRERGIGMSKSKLVVMEKKSLTKGLVAGLIGGLVGTVAKTFAERLFPAKTHEGLAAATGTGLALTTASAPAAEGFHWAIGTLAGAAYGALVEYYPAASSKDGASFGVVLGSLTHEGIPALGLEAEPVGQTMLERGGEMTSYIAYGVVTETVRGWVRRVL
jgi:putative membrane protein